MQQLLDLGLPKPDVAALSDVAPRQRFSDPAFQDNKITSIHRWVPWIAGFSANFVRDMISHYLPNGARQCTILEPFAGVGTTLVEGLIGGHEVIGFEVNPFAYLASRVKCNAHELSTNRIDAALTGFRSSCLPRIAAIEAAMDSGVDPADVLPAPLSKRPKNFKSRVPFFSPIVELKVLHCLDAIKEIGDAPVRDLFLLALGSLLVNASNYSYEPSLGSRVAAGRLPVLDDDVSGKLVTKILGMRDDIALYRAAIGMFSHAPSAVVYNETSLELHNRVDAHSVDLVVTSPPYLNNYHYIRNTRPQLYWLDCVADSADLKTIENASFGKFWQTVREQPPMQLDFDHPGLTALITEVAQRNPGRGAYSGQGWANYAVQYFNDSYKMCAQLKYVLRPGAHAVFVLGNSIVQGVEIPVDRIFGEIGQLHGLELADIHMLRTKRVGNSTVKSAARYGLGGGAALYETAVVLRQP